MSQSARFASESQSYTTIKGNATASAANPAEARVSPQEFACAVEQIEARREQERQRERETVAIGEAVGALGLTVEASEIWREVERQRARTYRPRRVFPRRWWIALLAVSLLLNIALIVLVFNKGVHIGLRYHYGSDAGKTTRPSSTWNANGVTNGFSTRLSDVKDEIQVYANLDILRRLAAGNADAAQIFVAKAENAPNTLWSLHRAQGHYLVHAWTSDNGALRLQNRIGGEVALFKESVGVNATRVIVPVEAFTDVSKEQGLGSVSYVTVKP